MQRRVIIKDDGGGEKPLQDQGERENAAAPGPKRGASYTRHELPETADGLSKRTVIAGILGTINSTQGLLLTNFRIGEKRAFHKYTQEKPS